MRCPTCNHDNREAAKFCEECAVPLAERCASCGAARRPHAKFCDECGAPSAANTTASVSVHDVGTKIPEHFAEKILRSKSALEGERKQVTVLFADVQGSMDLAEQMDPEAWSAIMRRFFAILADGVERFEGFVDKFTGDGIMALFGAPIAHEDHAQRACYAALHLRDAVRRFADELRRTQGLNFSARMGLNSGTVVVGKIGDDLRMDYTAQGHTVGLAQRMEQLAEPGTICLTEHTRRLVEGYFQLRDLGAFAIKGSSAPIEAAALEAIGQLRTRLNVSRARGFSRFVGRVREMETLQNALASALDGEGQVAGVVGDAGVGKSRLCLEFLEGCRARGIPVWQAHCPAHGRSIPMLPMLELTRSFFGITAQESPAEARRKVAGTLTLLDDSFRDDLLLAFDFLQIADAAHPLPPLGPEVHQQRLLAFIRRLFEKRSAQQAAVLFIDDLHWIDPDSDSLLPQIVEAAGATRTMLVLNFRPEYQAAWMHRSDYRRIPVLPLGDEALDEMLHNLLGDDTSVAALRARIRDRTKGNPFFAEELVLSLAGSGALDGRPGAYRLLRPDDEKTLPPTVQGIVAARIDRLGGGPKHVLQTAAVIGREFGGSVLSQVAGASEADLAVSLDVLQQAELIYETAIYPVREYVFKHPLTHEVAYGAQLQETRARTHARVAAAVAEVAGERVDEHAPLIAHHWEAAGEPVQSATWHARAARWNAMRSPTTATHHWRRARELLAPLETADALRQRAEACRELLFTSWRIGMEESEWKAVYEEGTALARRIDDKRSLAMLLSSASLQRAFAGELRVQVDLLEEALPLAQEIGDFALEASLHQRIGWAWGMAGNTGRDLEWTERGIRFCERDPSRAGRTSGFDTLAWLYAQHGFGLICAARFAEAERELERGDAAAIAQNDPFTRFYVRSARVQLARYRLDLPAMVLWSSPMDGDLGTAVTFNSMNLAYARLETGDRRGAAEAAEAAMQGFQTLGTSRSAIFQLTACATLADALARTGEAGRAGELLDEVRRDLATQPELRQNPQLLLCIVPAMLAVEGGAASAEIAALIDELQRAAGERGFVMAEPFALQYRGELVALLGDEVSSALDFRAAADLFRRLDCGARADALEQRLASPSSRSG